ncbi:MAG: efflux RND transporter periplasmic adaptor subunit [Candidatus Latescibacteria bacterium]|nr:efflux RND transporter periplasmic adaptor subunit [Candidatus Latescibacterota bacterium]
MRLRLYYSLLLLLPCAAFSQQMPPTPVIVAEVLRQQIADEVELVGSVQPRRASMVASEVEGKVVAVAKEAGQAVRRGDLLFQLDQTLIAAAVAEARADLALQEANQIQSTQLLAKAAISEQQDRDTAYQLARARAKLAGLEKQLADTAIRAPFSGHLVGTAAELGEWVARGEQVARLIATDTVRVYVNVPERHVPYLELGASAQVAIDALGELPLAGRIVAVLAEGAAESHTFPVAVELANPDGRIRSNMAARVHFQAQHGAPLLLVPKDALVTGLAGAQVFVAQEDKATARPVQVGVPYNGYVAVEGQLAPGELVIVSGNERLREGQAIRVLRKQE